MRSDESKWSPLPRPAEEGEQAKDGKCVMLHLVPII